MRTTSQDILAYTNEDLFTEEVVIPLFKRLAERAGYDQNGPVKVEFWGKDKRTENGIDVIFGYIDHLKQTKHLGIQCKIDKLTMGSNASLTNSIETITNQIQKAYRFSFTNIITTKDSTTKINGFYLITSKSIAKNARDYFCGLEYTNIELLECEDLVYLMNELFPERAQ